MGAINLATVERMLWTKEVGDRRTGIMRASPTSKEYILPKVIIFTAIRRFNFHRLKAAASKEHIEHCILNIDCFAHAIMYMAIMAAQELLTAE
jgi:hypothetical protein